MKPMAAAATNNKNFIAQIPQFKKKAPGPGGPPSLAGPGGPLGLKRGPMKMGGMAGLGALGKLGPSPMKALAAKVEKEVTDVKIPEPPKEEKKAEE